jgi:hypothetical protein
MLPPFEQPCLGLQTHWHKTSTHRGMGPGGGLFSAFGNQAIDFYDTFKLMHIQHCAFGLNFHTELTNLTEYN